MRGLIGGHSFWSVVVVTVTAGLLIGGVQGSTPANASTVFTLQGTVSSVVDGDTIKIVSRGVETPVRLVGIDTPETRDPRKPVQCYGPQASAMTKRLLPVGTPVTVISDPNQAVRDRYARFLGYVFKLGKGLNPENSVNYTLVRTGRAKVYVYGGVPFQWTGAYLRAQAKAKRAKAGLWGKPCNGNTTKPAASSRSAPAAPPAPSSPARSGCDPNYTGACIPPYPPDLDCGEIAARNFRSIGSDPHNFDVDHDGLACEQ